MQPAWHRRCEGLHILINLNKQFIKNVVVFNKKLYEKETYTSIVFPETRSASNWILNFSHFVFSDSPAVGAYIRERQSGSHKYESERAARAHAIAVALIIIHNKMRGVILLSACAHHRRWVILQNLFYMRVAHCNILLTHSHTQSYCYRGTEGTFSRVRAQAINKSNALLLGDAGKIISNETISHQHTLGLLRCALYGAKLQLWTHRRVIKIMSTRLKCN